jgi:hypothetical protein
MCIARSLVQAVAGATKAVIGSGAAPLRPYEEKTERGFLLVLLFRAERRANGSRHTVPASRGGFDRFHRCVPAGDARGSATGGLGESTHRR